MAATQILGIVAMVCIIGAAILTVYLGYIFFVLAKNMLRDRSNSGCQTNRAYQETKAYVTKGFFDAANDILQTAARYKYSGGNNHRGY
jgi:hypothetical protein